MEKTCKLICANGWSGITEIIARGEAEDNYLNCHRTLISGIYYITLYILYHAIFNNPIRLIIVTHDYH